MDIQVPYNIERIWYLATNGNSYKILSFLTHPFLMKAIKTMYVNVHLYVSPKNVFEKGYNFWDLTSI